jgi:hypothetical protein
LTGVVAVISIPVSAHTKSFGSKVTMKIGYGYFQGTVKSPESACREDRTVKLFKDVAGTDPVLKSTTTNSTGAWAIFRSPYETETFYVKVSRRKLPANGHKHTCKGAASPFLSAPVRTNGSNNGWKHFYFDCLQYASDPSGALPTATDPIFVEGPGSPPFGFQSLQLTDPSAPSGFSLSIAGWDGLNGNPLSDLEAVTYSTYLTEVIQLPFVKIIVDVEGDGNPTEEITFSPPSAGVAADEWQTWTADGSSTWDTPDGPMTLNAYRTANPAAKVKDESSRGGFQIQGECDKDGSGSEVWPYYMDAVIVETTARMLFDFES